MLQRMKDKIIRISAASSEVKVGRLLNVGFDLGPVHQCTRSGQMIICV